jgi:5-methylthioadenosine/S-adenosylhomocysteine deaminase
MRAAGIPLGLGSDTTGLPVSMFDLLRTALTVYRDATQDDLTLTLEDALTLATRGSARCLLREHELGAITPGRLADLVVVDVSGPRFALRAHPVPALTLLASPADVETVIVDGRVILDRGHFTTIDEERVVADAHAAARRFGAAH